MQKKKKKWNEPRAYCLLKNLEKNSDGKIPAENFNSCLKGSIVFFHF